MKKKFNILTLMVLSTLIFSSSASAVFVFMSSDATINNGQTASFTCTVDPAIGTANYQIAIVGNGINSILAQGSTSASIEQIDVSVNSLIYNGAGSYSIICSATEDICGNDCQDNDQKTATLIVNNACECAAYGVGWFDAPFWGGCSDAQNACSREGTAYAYCDGCNWDNNWDNHRCVSNNPGPNCQIGQKQCSGSNIEVCQDGCGFSIVENCDLQDGWYDTTETRTTPEVCQDKIEKKQEYRDYTCGGSTSYCEYVVTNSRWILISSTNKPDGSSCSDGLYCNGNEVCTAGVCISGTAINCIANNIPGISTCTNVPDGINFTFDFRTAFVSVCDETNDKCTTGNPQLNHTCSLACGAQCVTNADCNDGNSNTVDTCTGGCTCTHSSTNFCGDGVISAPETCELPNTLNNNYCQQSTSTCQGNLTGTRDAYGACSATCGCNFDPFTYACKKDSCGATCAVNADCQNKCVGSTRFFSGVCDSSNTCGCNYQTENCDTKDGWYETNTTRWLNISICQEKLQIKKEQRDYSCAPNGCNYTILNSTWVDKNETRNKPDGSSCSDGLYCNGNEICTAGVCTNGLPVDCTANSYPGIDRCDNNPDNNPYTRDVSQGFTSTCDESKDACTQKNRTFTHTCSDVCGAVCLSNAECDDKDPTTLDTCSACACINTKITGTCGDGIINAPESCELPGTQNNLNCPQSATVCQGNKTGVRDAYGACTNSCGCSEDAPTSFSCVVGTCGASCSANSHCDDGDNNTIDTCNTNSCGCTHTSIIPVCGNGIIDAGEQCDSNSKTCIDNSSGYSGTMSCGNDCKWTNVCIVNPFCGDNVCNGGESCSTCSADCGACPAPKRSGGGGSGSSSRLTAPQDWICTEWNECASGEQERTCTLNNLRKTETQNCTIPVIEKNTNKDSVKPTTTTVSFNVEPVSQGTEEDESASEELESRVEIVSITAAAKENLENQDLNSISGFAVQESKGVGKVPFSIFTIVFAVLIGGVLLHLYYFRKH